MRILSLPIHYVRNERARRRRIQTVLQMLSVSGVVRPGHVEPRYVEPSIHIDTLQVSGQDGILKAPTANTASRVSANISFNFSKLRQFVKAIRPSRLSLQQ
jgi:hypothetical protein